MATTQVFTYVDAVQSLLDWAVPGASIDEIRLRQAKEAIETAYRELTTVRLWSYYMQRSILSTVAPQSSSTIAFDYTGGPNERLVTLASGTWPSWSRFGMLRISDVDYEVASRESDTFITLSVNSNPGDDVASGTTYLLYRDTYPLPVDFTAMGTLRDQNNQMFTTMVNPADLVNIKQIGESPTRPREYAILADQNYLGTMAIRFNPPPDAVYNYEYYYRRRPHNLQNYQYNTGTVTTSGTTVTGTSAVWTSSMIGAAIRFSVNGTTLPTGWTGTNPYVAQRIITAFSNSGSVTIDQSLDSEVASVKYEISDPIDVESGAMYTAFQRRCELEMGQRMNREDVNALMQRYQYAERQAMEADQREIPSTKSRLWRRVPLYFTSDQLVNE